MNSWGSFSFNYILNEQPRVYEMASYMDITSDAEVFVYAKKALTSTVNIDPVVFILGMKYKS
ncbi:hypothetical protein CJF42_15620 [Pseudoalteromonas sp. NBT06-2]|uniref:hypothetical protein n=1 Tax=Pseudoalteromonas sp. NBT06-2 TaxID=2025950 RepID=UPI000BA555C8|nr:hypothetical protein [Pseudoalteromonas sp. NBT06-2]PAJ73482.1 hypothetical protein CJF42_15620 [Pseudoalteromonas sp. NBT06-2]